MEPATRFKLSQFSIEELLEELERRQKQFEEKLYKAKDAHWCLKLKEIRQGMNMSRKQFANLINTSAQVLAMAESGTRPKTAERFVRKIQEASKGE